MFLLCVQCSHLNYGGNNFFKREKGRETGCEMGEGGSGTGRMETWNPQSLNKSLHSWCENRVRLVSVILAAKIQGWCKASPQSMCVFVSQNMKRLPPGMPMTSNTCPCAWWQRNIRKYLALVYRLSFAKHVRFVLSTLVFITTLWGRFPIPISMWGKERQRSVVKVSGVTYDPWSYSKPLALICFIIWSCY